MKINTFIWKIFLVNILIVNLILGVLWVKNSFSSELTKKDMTIVNNEGAVEIRVTYLNPVKNINEGELAFEVRMNTHSVDLDSYRMEELTFLKDDKGNIYKPLGWFNPGGAGHHRFGIIRLSSKDSNGKDIISKKTKYITLVIKDIDNVKERSFQWRFPLK